MFICKPNKLRVAIRILGKLNVSFGLFENSLDVAELFNRSDNRALIPQSNKNKIKNYKKNSFIQINQYRLTV